MKHLELGATYFLFKFNLVQFGGLQLHIYSFKDINSINPEFKNTRKTDQSQDVGDFYKIMGE